MIRRTLVLCVRKRNSQEDYKEIFKRIMFEKSFTLVKIELPDDSENVGFVCAKKK